MYQYVLSKDFKPPLSLCVLHLRLELICNNDNMTPFKDNLIIVQVESPYYDQSVLNMFAEIKVSFKDFTIIFQPYLSL